MRVTAPALSATVLLSCIVCLSPARAQTSTPSRQAVLEIEDCLGATAEGVRRIVAAEIGTALLPAPTGPSTDFARIAVRCGVETAVLAVEHPLGVRLEQRVDLSGAAAPARGRLLALSIAELLTALWQRVDALPPPSAAPPPPAPAVPPDPEPEPVQTVLIPPAPAVAPPQQRAFGIHVVGALRVAGTPVHLSGGGGAGVEVGLPFSLGLGADLRYEYGVSEAEDDTSVEMHAVWGGARVLSRPIVGASSLALGLGARVGAVWLTGRPSAGAGLTHQGVVAGPTFLASTALRVAGRGSLFLGLELSWMLLSVSGIDGASGSELARFGGPQIALLAGFEIQPLEAGP
ncbi:MAG: hypothetical protein AB8I08_03330 [Sandaracinaceae bacterium]